MCRSPQSAREVPSDRLFWSRRSGTAIALLAGMLRISISQQEERICVILEGRLGGKWADELRYVILHTDLRNLPLEIDVKDVTAVDGNGEEVLRWLSRIGARFQAGTASTKWLFEQLGIPLTK